MSLIIVQEPGRCSVYQLLIILGPCLRAYVVLDYPWKEGIFHKELLQFEWIRACNRLDCATRVFVIYYFAKIGLKTPLVSDSII